MDLSLDDFVVKLKITEKQCFRSAGCNVTYRLNPSYRAPASNLEGIAFDLTCRVTGSDDGPTIGTISVNDEGHFSPEETTAPTVSSDVKLRAKAADVETF